jgi:hypothetical protein
LHLFHVVKDKDREGGLVKEKISRIQINLLMSTKISIADLKQVQDQLPNLDPSTCELVHHLVSVEIKRRQNAGRKKSSQYNRREQNRMAQKRFREKHIIMSAIERHKQRDRF